MLGYYVINYYHGRSLLWSKFSEIDQFLNFCHESSTGPLLDSLLKSFSLTYA